MFLVPALRGVIVGICLASAACALLALRLGRADRSLTRARETIGLLLRDDDDGKADWLWSVDPQWRLRGVSPRFAEAARYPAAGLEGRPFIDLFAPSSGRDLEKALIQGRNFHELVLEMQSPGEPRWWRLSGRVQADGGFGGVASDMTESTGTTKEVAYYSQFDSLTHLPNRAALLDKVEGAFEQMRSSGETFALHCIDIDNFKSVNDSLGHAAGDAFLKLVAGRLRDCVGPDVVLARLHGDDFAVLQIGATRETADHLADLMVDAMLAPVMVQGQTVIVGGSVGIAIAPEDGDDASELLRNAELALQRAKDHGRGCSRFFEPGMETDARARAELETDLRRALATDGMDVYFQPLVSAQTETPVGYETLLRWRRPGHGLVTPTEFIACAEETGVIVPLGEWAIRRAIEEAARWRDTSLRVAVNLSSAQFRNPAIVGTVLQALGRSGLDAGRLEIEITESVLMRETASNLRTLEALREVGVRIALDDFGTGFSSLNYLRAFPFDKLKIDQCFVRNIESSREAQAIVRSVIGLAKDLGMRVLAEGVETEPQAALLREFGCQEFQGFLFGRAVPASQIDQVEQVAQRSGGDVRPFLKSA
ncbi:EAL domain-containing protein [bacterium]|nr:EAL domain-containing protein [bacterium]